VQGLACVFVPDQRRLALIGEPDGFDFFNIMALVNKSLYGLFYA
jgi:hypothetical protein